MTASVRRWLLAASGAIAVVAAVLIGLTALAPAESPPAAPAEDSADVGFARDMSVHHQQAVEMSFIVRDRTDDEDVRRLAYDIINTQANQRGMMLGWLEVWGRNKSSGEPPMSWMAEGGHGGGHEGGMPGMATDEELDELSAAEGEDAEIRYLRLMTAHHEGGVLMAEAAAREADTEEIRNLAAGMVEAQESEIRLMTDMLADRGSQP
ncbi:DUF305 domain-containing protein [Streptomyces millisiae]|uniref:DUF305 domain-containing protein n=1 Tax=Streptomyces millisiae TaxID=3075542 RepID=A0ABU2LMS0_9ACTN|nr:DUF305 domain-containing protein [Streptomyces sp. DSM 44918]MDT0318895.1 DUF305 domain-containing protein [Streptomyces sp. DSM 44918]